MLAIDDLTPSQWIARCAERLGKRWRTAPLAELESAAVEVWRDQRLRELAPEQAAAQWLLPLTGNEDDHERASEQ